MKPVKWERVKINAKKIADGILLNQGGGYVLWESMNDGTYNWRNTFYNFQELIRKHIDKWDIRCIRKFHKLFPSCLPNDCTYQVEMKNDGEWWVIG